MKSIKNKQLKRSNKNQNFKMIGEASTLFNISDVNNNEFLIEIRGERKFKNIWIVKLNRLRTNLEEVNYYNDSKEV